MGGEGDGSGLSADECVRAGMYWFGRADMAAAEAWWTRALELDAQHARARECLRLLARASVAGATGAGVPDEVLAEIPTPPRATSGDLETLEPTPPDSPVPELLRAAEPRSPPGRAAAPSSPGRVAAPSSPGSSSPGRAAAPSSPGRVTPPSSPGKVAAPSSPGKVAAPSSPGKVAAPSSPGKVAPQAPSFLSQNSDVHAMLASGFGPPPPLPRVIEAPPLFPHGEPITDDLPSGPSQKERPPPPQRRRQFREDLDVDAAAWALERAAHETREEDRSIDLSADILPPHRPTESSSPAPPPPGPTAPRGAPLSMPPSPRGAPLQAPPAPRGTPLPHASAWDEGPSRTSVVTVKQDEFDAVAEPTPLPEVERERFFGRAEEQEIIGRLEEETVIAAKPPAQLRAPPPRSEDILFTEPVEFAGAPPSRGRREDPDQVPTLRNAPPVQEAPAYLAPEALLAEARKRFQLHDFDGVLELCERIPAEHPAAETARALVGDARGNLTRMYESKIGSFERAPRVLISGEEVIWLNLNHRAGFILSQIDGAVSYEDIIALSGMPRLDTLRILAELLQNNVIGAD